MANLNIDKNIKTETDQTNRTDSVYESTEETTAYHELGEFHDISNYDKLSWAILEET